MTVILRLPPIIRLLLQIDIANIEVQQLHKILTPDK